MNRTYRSLFCDFEFDHCAKHGRWLCGPTAAPVQPTAVPATQVPPTQAPAPKDASAIASSSYSSEMCQPVDPAVVKDIPKAVSGLAATTQ